MHEYNLRLIEQGRALLRSSLNARARMLPDDELAQLDDSGLMSLVADDPSGTLHRLLRYGAACGAASEAGEQVKEGQRADVKFAELELIGLLAEFGALPRTNAAELDDALLHEMIPALRRKLDVARAKGREGWADCSVQTLHALLIEHAHKGNLDFIDVALFALMLHKRTQRPADRDALHAYLAQGAGVNQ